MEEPDAETMMAAVTRAFIFLLAHQPNLTFTYSDQSIRDFPFEDYQLLAHRGEGEATFMLVAKIDKVC